MKKLMKRTKNRFNTVGAYKDKEYSCDCETTKCFCYGMVLSNKESVMQNPKFHMNHIVERGS